MIEVGLVPAGEDPHQRRLRGPPRHQRRLDPRADRDPGAPHGSSTTVPGCPSSPIQATRARAGDAPADIDLLLLAATYAWPTNPGHVVERRGLLEHPDGRRRRHERGLLRLRLRPDRRRRDVPGRGRVDEGPSSSAFRAAMSRTVDPDDRGTAILFGDGSGAVVIEAVDGPGQLLGVGPRWPGGSLHRSCYDRSPGLPADERQGGLPPGRPDAIRLESRKATLTPPRVDASVRLRHQRTLSRPTPGSSRRPARSSASRRTASPPSSSTAPATPARPGRVSSSPSSAPLDEAETDGDHVLLCSFGINAA